MNPFSRSGSRRLRHAARLAGHRTRRRTSPGRFRTLAPRLARAAAGTLAAVLLVLVAAGPAATATAATRSGPPRRHATVPVSGTGWQVPLAGSPVVLRLFDRPAERWSPGHRGVDLAAAAGADVLAAGPGVVSFAGRVAGRGVVVVVHGPLRTTYLPVTATVRRGRQVAGGEAVGVLERGTHCGERDCLHWGLLRGDEYLDPLSLLRPGPARLVRVWGLRPGAPDPTSSPGPGVATAGRGAAAERSPRRRAGGPSPARGPAVTADPDVREDGRGTPDGGRPAPERPAPAAAVLALAGAAGAALAAASTRVPRRLRRRLPGATRPRRHGLSAGRSP